MQWVGVSQHPGPLRRAAPVPKLVPWVLHPCRRSWETERGAPWRVCPGRAAVRELVQPRARAPLSCRALAGLDGRSQAALHRNACLRKTFASSFAALRKRAVCAQIKLQAVSAGAGTLRLRVGRVVAHRMVTPR